MARNRYPGYCYCCGAYVPTGYGHFELRRSVPPWEPRWRIKCVKCASGRTVRPSDREVKWAEHLRDQETKKAAAGEATPTTANKSTQPEYSTKEAENQ